MVHIFLLKAQCVFGKQFVTPTLREMRDQNPFFQQHLKKLNLTLADVSVDSFEAWHRLQKAKFHADLKAGGRGDKLVPVFRLLVPP
jgi:phosphoenolpyruvate carboxylase